MKLKKMEYILIGILLLSLFAIAWAADEKITVSSTPIGITPGTYTGYTNSALICVEGNAIRFTLDGIMTPTSGSAGNGIKLEINQCIQLDKNEHIAKFRAVRNSATDARINVSCW